MLIPIPTSLRIVVDWDKRGFETLQYIVLISTLTIY